MPLDVAICVRLRGTECPVECHPPYVFMDAAERKSTFILSVRIGEGLGLVTAGALGGIVGYAVGSPLAAVTLGAIGGTLFALTSGYVQTVHD